MILPQYVMEAAFTISNWCATNNQELWQIGHVCDRKFAYENETLKKQLAAAKSVIKAKESQVIHLSNELKGCKEAKLTLQSEREANAILTAEIEKLNAK